MASTRSRAVILRYAVGHLSAVHLSTTRRAAVGSLYLLPRLRQYESGLATSELGWDDGQWEVLEQLEYEEAPQFVEEIVQMPKIKPDVVEE